MTDHPIVDVDGIDSDRLAEAMKQVRQLADDPQIQELRLAAATGDQAAARMVQQMDAMRGALEELVAEHLPEVDLRTGWRPGWVMAGTPMAASKPIRTRRLAIMILRRHDPDGWRTGWVDGICLDEDWLGWLDGIVAADQELERWDDSRALTSIAIDAARIATDIRRAGAVVMVEIDDEEPAPC